MKILGLSSDGLLGYEAPRSGAFRNFFGPGGTRFGRRDIPVPPQGDTPPQMCMLCLYVVFRGHTSYNLVLILTRHTLARAGLANRLF